MSYPLYIPPAQFWGTKNSEWSLKEAKEYFNWFISIKDNRLDDYLEFLSVERNNIDDLCHKMLDLLFDPKFSNNQDGGKLDLTNAGYALATDTSLFVSDNLFS
ncbi:hypothetical protein [Sphingobacterium sp.]|uniref:hypothetical protein n=1 Tax=Sphingobacterium sp. TaxID=341027 RepID=UPI002586C9E8|nr:hypothetical protein [Sphingobacterium sp.]WET67767.1 MAG: hypothetical protein P0Y57_18175 [Sphingobacterium sp.]